MARQVTIRAAVAVVLTVGILRTTVGTAQTGEGLPSVTIEGQAELEKRVQTYVRKITSSTRFQRESVARWNQAPCFEIAGLPKRDAQFMVSRLTQIVQSLGGHVQGRECSRRNANFIVVFTPDPVRTLKYLKWHPRLLFDKDASIVKINQFLQESPPLAVRIWHNADLIGRNGRPVKSNNSCPAFNTDRSNCEAGGTRLTLQAVESLSETVMVFDANQINGMNIGQLSDYTAMAGLVDLNVEANLAETPTILRLFTQAEDARPQGLTEWDKAFLRATYHTDQKSFDQRDLIARNVVRELAHGP